MSDFVMGTVATTVKGTPKDQSVYNKLQIATFRDEHDSDRIAIVHEEEVAHGQNTYRHGHRCPGH